jgi:hypothetical protein
MLKSWTGAIDSRRKAKQTALTNDAEKAQQELELAQSKLEEAKKLLPGRPALAPGEKATDTTSARAAQEMLDKASREHVAARLRENAERQARDELKRDLEGMQEALDETRLLLGEEAVKTKEAEIQKKRAEIEDAEVVYANAKAEALQTKAARTTIRDRRDELVELAKQLPEHALLDRHMEAIKAAEREVLSKQIAADEATRAKAAYDEDLKSDALAQTMSSINATMDGIEALGTLISTITKLIGKLQKAKALVDTATVFGSGFKNAQSTIFVKHFPGTPGPSFNIVSSDVTTSIISHVSTIVGSNLNTLVTGRHLTASARFKMILCSKSRAELHGANLAALTSNKLVDIYSKQTCRVVAHPDKALKPTGKPDLFVAAENELELNSTSDSIRAYAKKEITMEAETSIYQKAKDELRVAGGTYGSVWSQQHAFIGEVSGGKEAKETEPDLDNGVEVKTGTITAKTGKSTLKLTGSGEIELTGGSLWTAKVGGTTVELTKSEILLG